MRVEDPEEIRGVLTRIKATYNREFDPEESEDGALIRMDARDP